MKNKNGWQPPTDDTISEVLGMEDDRLRAMVRAIAEAGGMSDDRADAVSRDADAIRRRLSSIRAEDVQKAMAQIPPEQMAALAEQLRRLKPKNNG